MKTLSLAPLSVVVVAAVIGVSSARASGTEAYNYEYVWDTPTAGFGGELFFTSSSGDLTDATLSDLSPSSYITTPDGTFSIANSQSAYLGPDLEWNSTGIQELDLTGYQNGYSWSATVNGDGEEINDAILADPFDRAGNWVPATAGSVPDGAMTLLLLGGSMGGLVLHRQRLSWRPVKA